jgi:hypothetical protein
MLKKNRKSFIFITQPVEANKWLIIAHQPFFSLPPSTLRLAAAACQPSSFIIHLNLFALSEAVNYIISNKETKDTTK